MCQVSEDDINSLMNKDIGEFMQTTSDYSFLFSQSNYFKKLCSIYWKIEDYLGMIDEEIERLYPSSRALMHDQPLYMDEEFQFIYKTLVLWHKTTKRVINKVDHLGKIYGFDEDEKRRSLWPWSREYLDKSYSLSTSKELFNKSTRNQRDQVILDYVRSVKYEYDNESTANATMSYKNIRRILLTCYTEVYQYLRIKKAEQIKCIREESFFNESEHFYYHLLPCHPCLAQFIQTRVRFDRNRVKYGVNSETFKKLGLPTLRPLYLFLINNLIDAVHFCNQVQLENKKNLELKSNLNVLHLLGVEVLTDQSRELIEDLIVTRQFCYHLVKKEKKCARLYLICSLNLTLLLSYFIQDL